MLSSEYARTYKNYEIPIIDDGDPIGYYTTYDRREYLLVFDRFSRGCSVWKNMVMRKFGKKVSFYDSILN
jgi:hypothetical protein